MITASVKHSLSVHTAQAGGDGESAGALLDMAEIVGLKKNEALTNLHETIHSDIAPCTEDRSENLRDTVQGRDKVFTVLPMAAD